MHVRGSRAGMPIDSRHGRNDQQQRQQARPAVAAAVAAGVPSSSGGRNAREQN